MENDPGELTRGERQMRELHLLFRGYAVSDVLIVLAAFGIGMWQMVLAETAANRVVPPDRQVISQVLMLVMLFLFETAYQVYLGIAYRISRQPARFPRYAIHKRLVAAVMVAWALFGHLLPGGVQVAFVVFLLANVVIAIILTRVTIGSRVPSE